MTKNQLAYQDHLEVVRANKAKETEQNRSNLAKERETERSNRVDERERKRHNITSEFTDISNSVAKHVQNFNNFQNLGLKALETLIPF